MTLLTSLKTGFVSFGLAALTLASLAPQVLATGNGKVITLSKSEKSTILKAHNQHRAAVNVPELEWSAELEEGAKQWVAYLAAKGGDQLIHASQKMRPGQGENLWKGSAGYFSLTTMVDTWAKEHKHFQPGVFPNVSKTGDGYSVSHYTQVVWKNTTKVGCAQARAGGNDLLVCRYNPAGNITGQSVF